MKPVRSDNTIQSRFGFQDPELTTPAHDSIMLWLDSQMVSFVTSLLGEQFKRDWIADATWYRQHFAAAKTNAINLLQPRMEDGCISDYDKLTLEALKVLADLHPVDWPGFGTIKNTWEYPINRGGGFLVGFADMLTEVTFYKPGLVGADQHYMPKGDYLSIDTNRLVRRGPNGFPEATQFTPTWQRQEQCRELFFEVKPSIRSLGEIIRQIRMYQSSQGASGLNGRKETETPDWWVVSPDDRFESALKSQGIGFLKCPAF